MGRRAEHAVPAVRHHPKARRPRGRGPGDSGFSSPAVDTLTALSIRGSAACTPERATGAPLPSSSQTRFVAAAMASPEATAIDTRAGVPVIRALRGRRCEFFEACVTGYGRCDDVQFAARFGVVQTQ